MRTKDNELVNRIKLYIEEQIDRYTSLAELNFSEMFHADIEHCSQLLLREVLLSAKILDAKSKFFLTKIHIIFLLSVLISQNTSDCRKSPYRGRCQQNENGDPVAEWPMFPLIPSFGADPFH